MARLIVIEKLTMISLIMKVFYPKEPIYYFGHSLFLNPFSKILTKCGFIQKTPMIFHGYNIHDQERIYYFVEWLFDRFSWNLCLKKIFSRLDVPASLIDTVKLHILHKIAVPMAEKLYTLRNIKERDNIEKIVFLSSNLWLTQIFLIYFKDLSINVSFHVRILAFLNNLFQNCEEYMRFLLLIGYKCFLVLLGKLSMTRKNYYSNRDFYMVFSPAWSDIAIRKEAILLLTNKVVNPSRIFVLFDTKKSLIPSVPDGIAASSLFPYVGEIWKHFLLGIICVLRNSLNAGKLGHLLSYSLIRVYFNYLVLNNFYKHVPIRLHLFQRGLWSIMPSIAEVILEKKNGRSVSFLDGDYSPVGMFYIQAGTMGIIGEKYRDINFRTNKNIKNFYVTGPMITDFISRNKTDRETFLTDLGLNVNSESKIVAVYPTSITAEIHHDAKRIINLFIDAVFGLIAEYDNILLIIKAKGPASLKSQFLDNPYFLKISARYPKDRYIFVTDKEEDQPVHKLTYQLMDICDFSISLNTSSTFIESLCYGKKAMFFYINTNHRFYNFQPLFMFSRKDEFHEKFDKLWNMSEEEFTKMSGPLIESCGLPTNGHLTEDFLCHLMEDNKIRV